MLHSRKWLPIACLVLAAQAVLEGIALFRVVRTNLLPARFLALIFLLALLMEGVTAVLLLVRLHGRGTAGRCARRIAAIAMAAMMGGGSLYVSSLADSLHAAVDKVTAAGQTAAPDASGGKTGAKEAGGEALLTSSGGGTYAQYAGRGKEPRALHVTEDPFIVYLSGSDTRSDVLETSRSDVNILMAVNPKERQLFLLNTPRDYYVANPAGGGQMDKLTHCGLYGVHCSMEALEDLYDTEVNYYGQINFTGFETLIDALGGITVEAPQDFSAGGFTYTAGPNTLNGAQALAFARERYAFAAGDNQRGKDQMEVIRAVVQKATSGETFLQHYAEILSSLEHMFVTDLQAKDIEALVRMQLADMSAWDIQSFAVSGKGGSEATYSTPGSSAYVMYQDPALVRQAAGLLEKVKRGERLTAEDVTPTAAQSAEKGEVQ